ncbi:MAG: carbon-nitrogen family hydrolase [Desulfobacteraceae bacterium]|nr:carbon-nitrogen family hydrolase [Desulfobacteraceae bacterium]
MMELNSVRAGFVQFDVVYGDYEHNLKEVEKGLEILNEKSVELAVLPEMWSCGFDYASLKEHCLKSPEVLEELGKAAKKYSMVIAGSLPEIEDNKIYNTMYVIEKDGSIKNFYRKIHLFSLTGEHKRFSRGEKPVVADTSVGRIGLLICYDLRFPELSRVLTDMNADIIAVSAQWPEVRQAHWEILLQARAVENQLFVIGCNRTGEDDRKYGGCSNIVSPKGRILYRAKDTFEAGFAELDFMEMIEYRSQIPSLEERVFEAYKQN